MIITGKTVFKICSILGILSCISIILMKLFGIVSIPSTSLITPLIMIVIFGGLLMILK
ncbi:hypothetical protein [Romboutsia lituseburensis]|uniref:hypothetical protein n=1 Tax=Romboutsia lituseburensis TaxID=1537 RepID=UPI00215AFA60|nr:hypothetical protein [Romboutsia lituseburensis]MCR8745706.1 hypothetical protein [Romboutsia lituseburensis]